jgi:serine/threonine-protein kinase RsbW
MTTLAVAKGIKFSIDSRLENIGLVGSAVQTLSSNLGFSKVEAHRIQLCIVEAVTNIVKHAYGTEAGHEIGVEVSIQPDRISFRITDTGEAIKSLSPTPLQFDPADRASLPERGMGLHIIHKLMDEVEYHTADGINILTMHKNRPKISPAS